MEVAISRPHGLLKPDQYDWLDTSLSLFDQEAALRKKAGRKEIAWLDAGARPGLEIWRIVKFEVTEWPKEEYGNFYDGDSYIVLSTYHKGNHQKLLYDVHVWIGKYSTPDEYGTACFKQAELDTVLDDIPVQHREVQGHESARFRSYFGCIKYLHGGADSGFRSVKPETYTPRLLHFHGDRHGVKITEVPRLRSKLDSTDVFILDLGLNIYQWNGSGCNSHEKAKALEHLLELRDQRNGKPETETLDEESTESDHVFYTHFYEDLTDKEDFDDSPEPEVDETNELYKLSDASGMMQFTFEKSGKITIDDFDSYDVFIFDTKVHLYIWIGKRTSPAERKNALPYAHKYLQGTDHPLIPVTCVTEESLDQDPHMEPQESDSQMELQQQNQNSFLMALSLFD